MINLAKSEVELRKVLSKLRRQFGHGTAEKFKKLLQVAGVRDNRVLKLLEQVVHVQECEICLRFYKTPPRPAAGFLLASDFNETVGVDLHQLEQSIWLLHIIDEFTRYSSASAIIRNKRSSTFAENIGLACMGRRKSYSVTTVGNLTMMK
jgi:hypothetical protein